MSASRIASQVQYYTFRSCRRTNQSSSSIGLHYCACGEASKHGLGQLRMMSLMRVLAKSSEPLEGNKLYSRQIVLQPALGLENIMLHSALVAVLQKGVTNSAHGHPERQFFRSHKRIGLSLSASVSLVQPPAMNLPRINITG